MIRDLMPEDREIFLFMVKTFYTSNAVAHNVNPQNFEKTFEAAMNKSPFMRAFMIEDEGSPIGYALLSFTYSNEVGGMVVWFEELYICETHRSRGFASKFFEFLGREYPSAKRIRFEVREDNVRAIDLYKKLGYGVIEYMQMGKDILAKAGE